MENTSSIITNLMDNASEEVNNGTIVYPISPIGPEFYDAYNIYLYLMMIFGVVGNTFVLLVFLQNPPSNTTDWFILAITVCDFISSFVNVPVYATFTNGYWRKYGTTFICRFHMFLSQSIVLSSSFLICGLALDRYIKVCKQLPSFTTARARTVCLLISVSTTALSTPCFVIYENRAGRCISIVMDRTLFAYYFLVFLIFIFATFVVVFSYCKVTRAVMESEANIARHTERTDIDERNKPRCCRWWCMPSYRNNRVAPSIPTVTRSGLFKDTLFPTSCDPSSGHSISERNEDNLQVPKSFNPRRHKFSSSRQSLKTFSESTDNQMHSRTTSYNHLNQRKSSSLRTTKISFLVCSVFILSWIPPWLCLFLASVPGMRGNMSAVKFMLFGRMTYLINGFSNPIIYTLLNRKFRSRFIDILYCRKLRNFCARADR